MGLAIWFTLTQTDLVQSGVDTHNLPVWKPLWYKYISHMVEPWALATRHEERRGGILVGRILDDQYSQSLCCYDDVIKWKHFPSYWPFVRRIQGVTGEFPSQSPVTLSFDVFFCAWINGWGNNWYAGDLRRHRTHYNVTVMVLLFPEPTASPALVTYRRLNCDNSSCFLVYWQVSSSLVIAFHT